MSDCCDGASDWKTPVWARRFRMDPPNRHPGVPLAWERT
jgi:hypothetical protein